MPKGKAPVKSTGGGGFAFEDRVAARFLAHVLSGQPPMGNEFGAVVRIDFQTQDLGWRLDDLLLSFGPVGLTSRCPVSVKSDAWVTRSGFKQEFVSQVWHQWTDSPSVFDKDKDLFVLVVGRIANDVKSAWSQLIQQALETDAERLISRLRQDGQVSELQRILFTSLQPPKAQAAIHPGDSVETVRLLRRLRVLHFDFESVPSGDKADSISLCRLALENGDLPASERLWQKLIQLSSESRPTGGYYDLQKLLCEVRTDFQLRDHPDYESDWHRLQELTNSNATAVRTLVGSNIHIDRADIKEEIARAIDQKQILAVVGESGTGKSALLAELVLSPNSFGKVLWITAEQLDEPNHRSVSHKLNLRHTLPTLIATSPSSGALAVFDGFERFAGASHDRAIELIKQMHEMAPPHWKAVVTCQPQYLGTVLAALVKSGIAVSETARYEVVSPPLSLIRKHVDSIAGLARLLYRRELNNVFRNLKKLDWVVTAHTVHPFVSQRTSVGESDVMDWIWTNWIGDSPKKHARAGVLRFLAEEESRQVTGAIPVSTIPQDQLEILGEFEAEHLLRVQEGVVHFAHDLLADWARVQVLLAQGSNVADYVKGNSSLPRWDLAIRFYAQRLLEQGQGLSEWKRTIDVLGGFVPENTLITDSFLDGIIFATNGEELLEQVWADVVREGGDILRRLLKRLLLIATVPDPRFENLSGPIEAGWLSATFRVPHGLYWAPMLRVLANHAADVAKLALFVGAEIAELWLRIVPTGFNGRTEAAKLAVTIAREAQGLLAEGVWFQDHCDQKVYEALLLACPELPDEVTQIGLEMSRRRVESAEIRKRRLQAEEKRRRQHEESLRLHPEKARPAKSFPFPAGPYGPLRAQAPDGPACRIHESFRLAVLDTSALQAMIGVRPACAREVLLAVCIEEPRRTELRDSGAISLQDYGMAHWPQGYPPMYFKGPFLHFLRTAPFGGVDAILRLVNYATERWFEEITRGRGNRKWRKGLTLNLTYKKRTVRWLGNGNVYAWYRSAPIGAHSVVCALMALEKWLYEQIEEKKPIDGALQQIFMGAGSVAFAGVMVEVGLYKPSLFATTLQPLLGNMALYQIQMELAIQEQMGWQLQLMGWAPHGKHAIEIVRQWHSMPHRQRLLREIARYLMFNDKPTAEFLKRRRREWSKLLATAGEDSTDLQFFLAVFDPKNYTYTPQGDGTIRIEQKLPPHLDAIAKQTIKKTELRQLMLSTPRMARNHLSGSDTFTQEQLQPFWEKLQILNQQYESSTDAEERRYLARAVAGSVAVLTVNHRDWLGSFPDKGMWCRDRVRTMPAEVNPEYYSSHTIMDVSVEAFVGEAALGLLVTEDQQWIRKLIFGGVTGFYYDSSLYVMYTAFRLRKELGRAKFIELLNVLILWAAVRRSLDVASRYGTERTLLANFKEPILKRYLNGELPSERIPLERAEAIGSRYLERTERRFEPTYFRQMTRGLSRSKRTTQGRPGIDPTVLQKGFGFLADTSVDVSEFPDFVKHCHELLGITLRMLSSATLKDDEISGTPYEYDRWVFARIAGIIPFSGSPEVARSLWLPILELGAPAHYWVSDFLTEWIQTGLQAISDFNFKFFGAVWQEMIEYTLESPKWKTGKGRASFYLDDLAADLVGLNYGARILKDKKYRPLLIQLLPTLTRWADVWSKSAEVGTAFAHFLATEAGQVLIPMGIKKLASGLTAYSDYDWEREHLGNGLAASVRACWSSCKGQLQTDGELHTAFLTILNELCKRLHPEALQLRTEIAQLTTSINLG